MKKIAIGLAVLVTLVGGGLYYLSANLDAIAKSIIETQGSAATKTAVALDGIKITLSSGEATLTGLRIASPEGFAASDAISAALVGVQLDSDSVAGNGPIIIRKVVVDKPQVHFTARSKGESNLQVIERNTKTGAGNASNTSAGSSRKVIIEDLVITNAQMSIEHELLKEKKLSATLPTIHLANIGKDTGGATSAQVAAQLLEVITEKSIQVAGPQLVKEIGPLKNLGMIAGEAAGGISDKLKRLLGN